MSTSELPDSNAGEAARWLDQARGDLAGARAMEATSGVPARLACFLAHLAAEKAMKACLIHAGIAPPRSHDLRRLQGEMAADVGARFNPDDLDALNPWTIEGRYPDDLDAAALADAEICIRASGRVLTTSGEVLGE